jgi:hypothetical protein
MKFYKPKTPVPTSTFETPNALIYAVFGVLFLLAKIYINF